MTWNTFPHYWFSLMRFCLAMIFLTKDAPELIQDMVCFLWLVQKLSTSSAAKFKVWSNFRYNKVHYNTILHWLIPLAKATLIARFMGPTWGHFGADTTQMAPMLAPWILLSGQWLGALKFSLVCTWTNGWVNNREAGDLKLHHAHYDVTVMYWITQYHWCLQHGITVQ